VEEKTEVSRKWNTKKVFHFLESLERIQLWLKRMVYRGKPWRFRGTVRMVFLEGRRNESWVHGSRGIGEVEGGEHGHGSSWQRWCIVETLHHAATETFHVTGKVDQGVGCHVLEGWRLPSVCYRNKLHQVLCSRWGLDIESKRVSTAGASRWNIPPHTYSLVIS
jgi:hypothetical protein